MRRKNAIISVSDKSNLNSVLKILKKYNFNIISSGGTFNEIKKKGFKSIEVSNFTGFPEILNGRVKTLHPKIHAGILNKRNKKNHKVQMKRNNFENIDLVIVNFYPFERIINETSNQEKIIENIDIGGPSLARAAAKNFNFVTVITNTNQYGSLENELKKFNGNTSLNFRKKMSKEAFSETGQYDALISNYLQRQTNDFFPEKKILSLTKKEDLRYGENPHQASALYSLKSGLEHVSSISGKKLSYNNYNDYLTALQISRSLPKNRGTVIIKHASPCGVSINENKLKSFDEAYNCDPLSAFGGIVSFNFKVNKDLALKIKKLFIEVISGEGFEKNAVKILKKKKNLRIIDSSKINLKNFNSYNSIFDNFLVQTSDINKFSKNNFFVASKKKPSKKTFNNLIFTFNICRFVKSNSIVLSQNFKTIGIGSGQPSRLDSCLIAIEKMKKNRLKNNNDEICAASDAFFPFLDGFEKLVQAGATAIIQPFGSIRDKEIIKFANKMGIVLIFSKTRHFRH